MFFETDVVYCCLSSPVLFLLVFFVACLAVLGFSHHCWCCPSASTVTVVAAVRNTIPLHLVSFSRSSSTFLVSSSTFPAVVVDVVLTTTTTTTTATTTTTYSNAELRSSDSEAPAPSCY